MSNSAVSLPSPLADVPPATPGLSVVSTNQHDANVSTAPSTDPSQVPVTVAPAAPGAAPAAAPSFLIPPVQTAGAPNPSIPFQIVRRKIIVHGTGGPACSVPPQTIPSVKSIVAVPDVLQIIQNQSAGQVHVLPNEQSAGVQRLKNPPATNFQVLKNPPATKVQALKRPRATTVRVLKSPPAANVQMLKNPPATTVQIRPKPVRRLQNRQLATVQIMNNQPATNVQIMQNQPATNVQIMQNQPATNVQFLQNQPQTNIQIVQSQPQANVQWNADQPQFVNQLQSNFQIISSQSQVVQNQAFGNMQVISGPTQIVQKPVQGSMTVVRNLQVAPNQSPMVQNLQMIPNQSQMVQNLQVAPNQSQMVQNLQVAPNQSQMVQKLQMIPNQSQMVQNLQVAPNQSPVVQNLQMISNQSQIVQNLQVAPNQSQMVQNLQVMSNQSQMVQNLQVASNQPVQNRGMMLAQVQTPDGPQVVESKTGTLGQCPETGGQVFTPAGGGPPLPVYRHPSRAKSAPKSPPSIVVPRVDTPQDNVKKVVDTVMEQVPKNQTNSKGLLRDLLLPRFDKLCPVEKTGMECARGRKKRKRKRQMDEVEVFDKAGTNKAPVFFSIDKPCTVDAEMEVSFGGTSLIPKFAIEFCPGRLRNYVSAVAQAAITYKSKSTIAKLEHEAKLERRRLKQENRNHALKILKMAKEAESSIKISRRKQTLAIRNDHFDDDDVEFQSPTKKNSKLISASIAHANKSKKTAHKRMKSKGLKGSVSKMPSEQDKSSITLSRRKQTLAIRSDNFDDVELQSKKNGKITSTSMAHKRMISKGFKDNVSKIPSEQDEAVTDVIAEVDLGKVTINPNPGNSNTAETLATVEVVTDKSVMSTSNESAEVPTEVGVFIPPSISKEGPLSPDQADVTPSATAVDPAVIDIAHTGSDRIRIAVSHPDSITEVLLPLPMHKIKIEPRECSLLSNSASSTSSSTSLQATGHALQSHEGGKAMELGTDMDTCSSVPTASPLSVKSVKTEPVEANIKHELDPRKVTSEELPSADPFQPGEMPPKTKVIKRRAGAMDNPKPAVVYKTETPDEVTRTSEDTLPGTKGPQSALRRKTARTIVAPARYKPCKTTGGRVKLAQAFEQSKQAPVLGPFNFISKPSEICVTPQVPVSASCETVQKKPVFIVSESVYKALYNAHTTGKSLHLNSSPSVPPVSKNGQMEIAAPQLETNEILKQFQMATEQILNEPHSQMVAGQSSGQQIDQAASEKSIGQTATPVGMQNLPTMMSIRTLLHQAVTSSQGEHSKHLTTPIVQQLNSTQRSSPLPKSNKNSKDEDVIMRVPGIQAKPVRSTAILEDLNSFLERSVNEIPHNQDAIASELNIESVFSLNESSCNLMNKVPNYLEMCLNSRLEHSLGLCFVVLDRKMPPGFRGELESKKTRLPVPGACEESCRMSSLNFMCNCNMLDSVKLGQIEEVVPVSKCPNPGNVIVPCADIMASPSSSSI